MDDSQQHNVEKNKWATYYLFQLYKAQKQVKSIYCGIQGSCNFVHRVISEMNQGEDFGVLAMMCFLANQSPSLNFSSFIKKLKIGLLQTHGAIRIKFHNLRTSYLKTHTITWNHFFHIEGSDFIT